MNKWLKLKKARGPIPTIQAAGLESSRTMIFLSFENQRPVSTVMVSMTESAYRRAPIGPSLSSLTSFHMQRWSCPSSLWRLVPVTAVCEAWQVS